MLSHIIRASPIALRRPVAVTDGGEQTIVIELRRVQPFHVRGTIASPSGRSPAGLQVLLQQTFGGGGATRSGGLVQQDGTFDISGVAPGSYTLMARVSIEANAEFAVRDIQVVDHDVDGVVLVLGTGGSINGRIVLQGAGVGPAPLGVNLSMGPVPGQTMSGRPIAQVAVAEDWTFQVRGLYGTYRIGVPMALIGEYRPARFELDGREIPVANSAITIREGEHQLIMYFAPVSTR